VGSLGTIGVMTDVCIKCAPKISKKTVCMMACDNFDSLVNLMRVSKSEFRNKLSMFDFMDYNSITAVQCR
jgi:FAD/FMN-containing dehydrogenase